MTIIKCYVHDDAELLQHIAILMGSDDWQREHKQGLRRQAGKVFYLLFKGQEFASMCSVYKNQIMDLHTLPKHRGNGFALALIQHVTQSHEPRYIGSANPIVERMVTAQGFVYYLSRGQYRYFKNNAGALA